MKARYSGFLLIVVLLSLGPLLPGLNAQTTYTVPLFGARWTTYEIGVKIPNTPTQVHDTVAASLKIWNQAQAWFKTTYFPNGKIYTLVESTSGPITVTYQDRYNGYFGGFETPIMAGGKITSAHISIVISYSDLEITEIATHELGHALGLDHADTLPNDLMYGLKWNWQYWPSTLDLFAVHILASGQTPEFATLPQNIPYETFSPTTSTTTSLTATVSPTTQTKTTTTSHSSTTESQDYMVIQFSKKSAVLLVAIVAAAGLVVLLVFSRRRR